jgi:hypothetical protein
MPHQQYLWDVALEIDPRTGMFAYSEVTFVGPRQVSGKTEQILPVMIHRCTGIGRELVAHAAREYGLTVQDPGAQRVFFTAQTADDARTRWRDVHVARIRKSPLSQLWSQPPRLTQNKESMFWVNGSSWVPGSTTGKTGGTGDTIDMGVIDEAWSRTDNSTELGMRPAMMTRPWSQLWQMSMVPGASRVEPDGWPYLKQKMKTGRQRVEADHRRGRAYIEFSAPDDADPADPDTWWGCMPGLGFTVPEDRVAEDHGSMALDDFKAEYLGVWPTGQAAKWETISKGTWDGLRLDAADYLDPVAVGVDANPSLTLSSLSIAALMPGGDVHVEFIDRRSGINWIQDAILSMVRKYSVCAIGIDRNGPLAGLVVPLTRAAIEDNLVITIAGEGKRFGLNSGEVAAACATFYNMTGEQDDAEPDSEPTTRRVRHLGQPELDQSVGGVIKRRQGDRWRWDRDESTADTGPLFAATLAVAAGESEEWIGGAYDIMDSLG